MSKETPDWDGPVIEAEGKILDELAAKAHRERERAEACKCGTCRHGAEKAEEAYFEELDRQTKGEDQEEERVAESALAKLESHLGRRMEHAAQVKRVQRLFALYAKWDGTGDPESYLDELDPDWRDCAWDNKKWLNEMEEWLTLKIDHGEEYDDDDDDMDDEIWDEDGGWMPRLD